jgi:hypothetical protein
VATSPEVTGHQLRRWVPSTIKHALGTLAMLTMPCQIRQRDSFRLELPEACRPSGEDLAGYEPPFGVDHQRSSRSPADALHRDHGGGCGVVDVDVRCDARELTGR